ncbi:MAG: PqqD family protein [Ruminococcaceae bacterium]|nr:PqqD family protein [Oscillospiraceae bacterium]MBQ8324946.1 PqqD family protein [Clostridia bacterium]
MRIKEGFLLRETAGRFIVLPLGGELDLGSLITLNETGAFLWRLLEEGKSRKELLEALLEEYDVTRERAEKDLDALLAKMEAAGLLED